MTIYCDYLNQYTDDNQLTKSKKQYKENKETYINVAIITLNQLATPLNLNIKLYYESLSVRQFCPDPQFVKKKYYNFGHISTKTYPGPQPKIKICGMGIERINSLENAFWLHYF